MKTKLAVLSFAALSGALMAGCTTAPQPVAKNRDIELRENGDRSYSKKQLDKTGRQTPGEALSQVDPAVSVSGAH